MSNIPSIDAALGNELLSALSQQLDARGETHTIVVIGGSGLIALELVSRTTRDVDVVALLADGELVSAKPLPEGMAAAAGRVADDFGLPTTWLNNGPADLLDFGLPEGFLERAVARSYGRGLQVLFASRLDQIHFKLYAAVDRGGQHFSDLQALQPTKEELLAAAFWSETHDTSSAYRELLDEALSYLGVEREHPDR
jgi:hypothetical protein